MKSWLVLKENTVSPLGSETVEDHVHKLETQLDVICALVNLNLLAKNGRLQSIPSRATKAFELRLITDLKKTPELKLPKEISEKRMRIPGHLEQFKLTFASIAKDLEELISIFQEKS